MSMYHYPGPYTQTADYAHQAFASWYSYAAYQAAARPPPPAPTTPAVQPSTSTSTFSSYNPNYVRDSTSRGSRGRSQHKGLFAKELPKLMYGFGDDKQVANDTVAVMEEILIEYIVDVCQTALVPTRKTRLQIEDLRRALSRPADSKKLARMEELLFMQEDIKRARKQFEENEDGAGIDF